MTPPLVSNINFDLIAFVLLAVTAINLMLAGVVARAGHHKENHVFAFMAASVALWTLTNALFRSTETVAMATLWAQIAYLSAL